ncbi:MAG: DUF4375 domain-containing protein [Oscillospiraceae bacterium]|nr:DUF4375 domain-containing protein [Oscillospiraceae bacterium]
MSKFDFLSFAPDGIFPGAEEFMAKQKEYASLKREELEGIPENEIVLAVTSWIEGKFSEDWSDMCDVINSLPTPCLNLYCADYVTKELLNGGFAQAFFNSSRDYIGAAAEGFRALDYPEPADIIEDALKINFDSGKKASGRSIEDFLDFAGGDEYDSLDKDFCKAFDEKKFDKLAYSYIMHYKKYFGEE